MTKISLVVSRRAAHLAGHLALEISRVAGEGPRLCFRIRRIAGAVLCALAGVHLEEAVDRLAGVRVWIEAGLALGQRIGRINALFARHPGYGGAKIVHIKLTS